MIDKLKTQWNAYHTMKKEATKRQKYYALGWAILVFLILMLPVVAICVNILIISLFNHSLYILIIYIWALISSLLSTRLYYELLRIYTHYEGNISVLTYKYVYLLFTISYFLLFTLLFFITNSFVRTFTI